MPGTAGVPWVAIIVVNWNGAEDTISCLDSLAALRYSAWRAYVVDNASTDDSVARVAAAHPRATIVAAPRNLGYAGAFNLGRQRALDDGAPYLWLLNNDTIVASDALDHLLEADRAHGPAIFSTKILYRDQPDLLWYDGGYLEWDLHSHHLGQDEPDNPRDSTIRPIEWATGCSLFCSADLADRLGPMDERYFVYLEDVDWCLRARKQGFATYYVPSARVYHGVSRTVNRLESRVVWYYAWRNYYLLVREHGRWWQRLYGYADLASRFLKIALRHAMFPSYRSDRYYQARTQGLIDFVNGRFGEGLLSEDHRAAPRTPREALS